jgi:hypothetical protein
MKICSLIIKLTHADGQTDMPELKGALLQLFDANATKLMD